MLLSIPSWSSGWDRPLLHRSFFLSIYIASFLSPAMIVLAMLKYTSLAPLDRANMWLLSVLLSTAFLFFLRLLLYS